MNELIARLMAAIETPADLTQEDVNCLLEDAHIALLENDKRAKDLPAREDKFIWVLDASSGDVLRIEVPSHFPENGDYENYLERFGLPEGYRLKDCSWMVGGFHFREVVRERYHLGF